MYQMAIKQNQTVNISNKEVYKKLLMLGAVGGIVLGVLLSLIGIFLSIEVFAAHFETHRLEILFLVSSFVFLAVGAHCMDKIDKVRKPERVERCQRNGLSDRKQKLNLK